MSGVDGTTFGLAWVDPFAGIFLSGGIAVVALALLRYAQRRGDRLATSTDGPLVLASGGPIGVLILLGLWSVVAWVSPIFEPLLVLYTAVFGPILVVCSVIAPLLPPYPWPCPARSGFRGPFVHWFARVFALLAYPYVIIAVLLFLRAIAIG